MYLAYLTLISGLFLSLISEFYSIAGLMTIFAANPTPVAIMGIALGIGKLVGTVWLKQNWDIAPASIKAYLVSAILILMLITSLGCFGLLSKAHSDQSLVSGDVLAKISIYDEQIKTAKENIETNRKSLKQLDEAVDQVMLRSQDTKGADKSVAIRKSQARDRARLQAEIAKEQKSISVLNEQRAPIAAEVRKVEAEVGPIKYIAAFFYGSTDTSILEKSVTWVIIALIIVFDPLAVILLLASQISFQNLRERAQAAKESNSLDKLTIVADPVPPIVAEYEPDDGAVTDDQIAQIKEIVNTVPVSNAASTEVESIPDTTPVTTVDQPFDFAAHPYLLNTPGKVTPPGIDPVLPQVHKPVAAEVNYNPPVAILRRDEPRMMRTKVFPRRVVEAAPVVEAEIPPVFGLENYIQNEEQNESNLWTTMNPEEFINSDQATRDKHIANIVAAVKARTMEMSDVPEMLQNDVKARV